jgi:hypothetical protein
MNDNTFTIQDAKQIDLVQYLEKLGHQPKNIKNHDFWYSSPLRAEKTPSFKVNTKINCWYDFGTGKGGTIIDFGIEYFKCSVKEFLGRLKENNHIIPRQTVLPRRDDLKFRIEENQSGKIKILDFHSIKSPALTDYIKSRSIDLEVAKKYCHEVNFELYNRTHTAIGFKNDTGGFELRNAQFKGGSSPKFTTLICRDADYNDLSVFEGFFNFLSYQTDQQKNQNMNGSLSERQPSFLILNSLSFFEMSRSLMERHKLVNLYLDRDKAGIQHTQQLLHRGDKYIDCSTIYKGFKDYNDKLTNKPFKEEQTKRLKRRL